MLYLGIVFFFLNFQSRSIKLITDLIKKRGKQKAMTIENKVGNETVYNSQGLGFRPDVKRFRFLLFVALFGFTLFFLIFQ